MVPRMAISLVELCQQQGQASIDFVVKYTTTYISTYCYLLLVCSVSRYICIGWYLPKSIQKYLRDLA